MTVYGDHTVTAADRAAARSLWGHCMDHEGEEGAVEWIAAAIAAERERVLAPIRALADELDAEAQAVLDEQTPAQVAFAAPILVQARAVAQAKPWIADRLRAVLPPTSTEEGER